MKTLFICGALEQGKDGVGDYTRRLAGELIRQGHQATIIAYNDRHISTIVDDVQQDDDTVIKILRLSSVLKGKDKVQRAREYIRQFQPDWISLQFVLYSFHAKGLPFFLGKQLKQIGEGYKWHIMFHELWIGMNTESPIKERLIGKTQKSIIKGLVKQLDTKYIHTNTTFYLAHIKNLTKNIRINKLSLFSNIPIRNIPITKDRDKLIFIFFGAIHPYTDISAFINWCIAQQNILNSKIEFQFIGKNGSQLDQWINTLESENLSYVIHGFQNTDSIAKLLSIADIGITTTPHPLVEKSGAVAAMLTMGLPVLCSASRWNVKDFPNVQNTPVLQWSNKSELTAILHSKSAIDLSLGHITKTLIQDLNYG